MKDVIKQIAADLNNREYPLRVPKEISQLAKDNNVVIVYGASDDLMELDGAIYDEYGAYDGDEYPIDKDGFLYNYNGEPNENAEQRESSANLLKSLWCKTDKYSFTYELNAPHEKFDVKEGDDYYCQGIVFCLDDLGDNNG